MKLGTHSRSPRQVGEKPEMRTPMGRSTCGPRVALGGHLVLLTVPTGKPSGHSTPLGELLCLHPSGLCSAQAGATADTAQASLPGSLLALGREALASTQSAESRVGYIPPAGVQSPYFFRTVGPSLNLLQAHAATLPTPPGGREDDGVQVLASRVVNTCRASGKQQERRARKNIKNGQEDKKITC